MRLFTEFSHIDTTEIPVGSDGCGVRRVRLCTDCGASSNGLRHVVAPLSLLKLHCVHSVRVRTAGEHQFLLKIMQGIGGQTSGLGDLL